MRFKDLPHISLCFVFNDWDFELAFDPSEFYLYLTYVEDKTYTEDSLTIYYHFLYFYIEHTKWKPYE